MKYLKALSIVALSAAFILTGCGKDTEEVQPVVEPIIQSQPAKEETTQEESAEEETAEEDVPPEEGMVRSPLTNEWISGDLENVRPIAIMSPNDSGALPHYNLSKADILYECPVEGGITRSMAVIKDWEGLDRIGNVRSCRDYFVYWALEADSIYVHFGGPFYINDIIEREGTDNITGCNYGETHHDGLYANAFYRTTDRKAPQNAYASADGINEAIDKLGYSKTYRDQYYQGAHYKFAPSSTPNTLEAYSDAIDAKEVDLTPAYPITKTSFSYNAEDGLYYRSIYGKADVDGATNEQLSFKNIIIQSTYYEVRDAKGYLAFQVHDTTRDGYYITNGKAIHVNWKKTADYEPTKYYDDNGNEVEFNTGKTMVCIIKDGDSFLADGVSIN